MMIQDVDTDESGEIDIDEFMAMMAAHLGLVEPDDSREAFKCLDSKTEGQVLTADLKEILGGMDSINEEQLNMIMLELDPDNLGKIDFHCPAEDFKDFQERVREIPENFCHKDKVTTEQAVFFCNVCNCDLKLLKPLRDHVTGSKHIRKALDFKRTIMGIPNQPQNP